MATTDADDSFLKLCFKTLHYISSYSVVELVVELVVKPVFPVNLVLFKSISTGTLLEIFNIMLFYANNVFTRNYTQTKVHFHIYFDRGRTLSQFLKHLSNCF